MLRSSVLQTGVAFLLGATVSTAVSTYWWSTRKDDPKLLRQMLVENPQFLADNPDVLAAARVVLKARQMSVEGESRARLLAGGWAQFTHVAVTPSLGNPTARSVLIEFTDYGCDPCRASASAVMRVTSRADLRVAVMLLPTSGAMSEFAARVGYAAYRQNPPRFARFHESLMRAREPLSASGVLAQAAAAGLDVEQIQEEIGTSEVRGYLAQVRGLAEALRVPGVPTFVFGKRLLSGALSEAQLDELVADDGAAANPMVGRAIATAGVARGAAPGHVAGLAESGGLERRFSLVDAWGRAVSETDFRGRWLLVFFGFTRCPDVCPTTLGRLGTAFGMLGADANSLQVIFITIDPEHDTPVVLASYLKSFGGNFLGLTGLPAQIEAAARSFSAYQAHSAPGESAASALAHSSTLYLVDPEGRLNRQFSGHTAPDRLAVYLRKALRAAPHADSMQAH